MVRIPKGKVVMCALVDEEVLREFKKLAFERHEKLHGAISRELEQALRHWIALHTQKAEAVARAGPGQPKYLAVFEQVKRYLKERYGQIVERGSQIPRDRLVEAIMAVRGCDKRTIRKWMEVFVNSGLVKPATPDVYEVL